jgi:putative flavoprotein involved in K+ transport
MATMGIETVIVGGGQAGLAMGYELRRRGRSFVILESSSQVGDSWRHRWDSLRLFTPARYDGLPGMPFPAPGWSFPTGLEFAGYLQEYADRFRLPVRTGVTVKRLTADFVLETDDGLYEPDNIVVATGFDQRPRPYGPGIHSSEYRRPSQLADGDVLVVGAGNSGADIALELAATRRVLLSGRHPGQLPWRIERPMSRLLAPPVFFAFRHLLTARTPAARRLLAHSGPLIRVKNADLAAAGVIRVPRVTGLADGHPVLADGRTIDVPNVIWCTGFEPDTSWIECPGFDGTQRRGITGRPGLYLLGWMFQHALASSMVQGVGRDAAYLADHIAHRPLTS